MKAKLGRARGTRRRPARLPLLLVCCCFAVPIWFSPITKDIPRASITADTLLPENELLRNHVVNTRTMAKQSTNIPCQSHPQQTNLQACDVPFPTKFYSEGGQDRYILDKFFRNRCSGTFIELGATNGIQDTNAKMLEDSLKWTGTCIEPNSLLFADLQKNRPACRNVNAIISAKHTTETYLLTSDAGYNGIEKFVDWNKLNRANVTVVERIPMPGLALMDVAPAHHVDLLSLDVEGGELAVLETIDYSRLTFGVMLVEGGWKPEIRMLLESKGYQLVDQIHWDAVWVNKCLYNTP